MKKIALFLLLLTATFSLSSFGIISNPRAVEHKSVSGKTLSVNSKSVLNSKNGLTTTLEIKQDGVVEKEESTEKNFLKTFFGFIISALSQIVMSLMSK